MTAKQLDGISFVGFLECYGYGALNELIPFNPRYWKLDPGIAPFEWEGHSRMEESWPVGGINSFSFRKLMMSPCLPQVQRPVGGTEEHGDATDKTMNNPPPRV